MHNSDGEATSQLGNEQANNISQHYKKSSKISYRAFKDLFAFEENDRDKKQLKKDYKRLEKENKNKVKFKHLIGKIDHILVTLIDYYLQSSEQFGGHLKHINA